MDSIVEKLKQYLEYKSIPVSVAEKRLGLSNGTLSKPFHNGTTIKTDTLEKFLNVYFDINPNWLLYDEGNMIRSLLPKTEDSYHPRKDDYIIELQRDKIEQLKSQLKSYEDEKKAKKNNLYVAEPEPKLEKSVKKHR